MPLTTAHHPRCFAALQRLPTNGTLPWAKSEHMKGCRCVQTSAPAPACSNSQLNQSLSLLYAISTSLCKPAELSPSSACIIGMWTHTLLAQLGLHCCAWLPPQQGHEKAMLTQVRLQFKANMKEVDDDRIKEQKEAAIRWVRGGAGRPGGLMAGGGNRGSAAHAGRHRVHCGQGAELAPACGGTQQFFQDGDASSGQHAWE